jgi:serine protease Do
LAAKANKAFDGFTARPMEIDVSITVTSRAQGAALACIGRGTPQVLFAQTPLGRALLWGLMLPLLALVLSGKAFAQRSAPETFATLAEKSLPAVVSISTSQTLPGRQGGRSPIPLPEVPPGSPFEEFFREFNERQSENNLPRRAQSLGSGFVIDPSGYIVTNNHVIDGAEEIKITLQQDERQELKATLIGVDKETDLALLKVETARKLPALKWGDSDALRVGDWVMAIGNPLGLGGTVTTGIVSARARAIGAGRFDDFIQTDAAINRGNSGGPLVNLQGDIVGINTAIFSQTGGSIGIGFAIPASLARTVIEQIKNKGKVQRAWLGVQIQAVTPDIAESMGLPSDKGALVGVVTDNSPAMAAGLKAGDVIISFDGKEVISNRALPRMVAETAPGKKVALVISRKGQRQTVAVTLAELPDDDAQAANISANEPAPTPGAGSDGPKLIDGLGVTAAPLNAELRRRFELSESAKGLVITKINPSSLAGQQQQLRPGDLILEINQQPVGNVADAQTQVAEAKKKGRKTVLVLVERRGEQQFLPLGIEGGKP